MTSIVQSLRRNYPSFDKLDLSDPLPACQIEALESAFADNTTVRSVYLRRAFLKTLSQDDRQRIIQALGFLPNVTNISIVMPYDDESIIPIGTFASLLQQARCLQQLELCCLQFPSSAQDEDEILQLSQAIRSHSALQEVSFWLLKLTDPRLSLDPLLQALANVPKLKRTVIDLRTLQGAPFSCASLQRLCQSSTLQSLTLGQIDLQDEEVLAMTTELQHNSVLNELGLCGCNLSSAAATAIAQMLEISSTLQRLELTENPNLGDAGCIAIAKALRKNSSLKRLFLVDNPGLSIASHRALVEALQENHHLENVSWDCTAHDLMAQLDHYLQLNRSGTRAGRPIAGSSSVEDNDQHPEKEGEIRMGALCA